MTVFSEELRFNLASQDESRNSYVTELQLQNAPEGHRQQQEKKFPNARKNLCVKKWGRTSEKQNVLSWPQYYKMIIYKESSGFH